MPRKPWKLRTQRPRLSPAEVAYLTDAPAAPDADLDVWVLWCYRHGLPGFDGDPTPRALWQRWHGDFLPAFLAAHPCTRPLPWWQWSAPQEPVPGWPMFFCALRRRLGGTGQATHEVSASWGEFEYGIPVSWLDAAGAQLFGGVAVCKSDPPTYESQAAYLERHGLLTAAERRWLRDHPEARSPEAVTWEEADAA